MQNLMAAVSLLVAFRGRATDGILADAEAAGLKPDATRVIVCREGDAMAAPGDVTADGLDAVVPPAVWGTVGVIANGGTTAQLVKTLMWAQARGNVVVFDLQRDGVTPLYARVMETRWVVSATDSSGAAGAWDIAPVYKAADGRWVRDWKDAVSFPSKDEATSAAALVRWVGTGVSQPSVQPVFACVASIG